MNVYQEALDVQDAVNLTAVSGLLNRVCKHLLREEKLGTDAIRGHAAVTMIVDKILDLNGRPNAQAFGHAHDTCVVKAGELIRCEDCGEHFPKDQIRPYKFEPDVKLCDGCHDQRMEGEG